MKVPFSIARESDIYTPKNLKSIWNHHDLDDELLSQRIRNSKTIDRTPRTFNLNHLKEINRLLGDNILPSAGSLRDVELTINECASYASVGKLSYSNVFNVLEDKLNSQNLIDIQKDKLASILGNTHTLLSYTKPFRFNNERTTSIFINQIVEETNYNIEYDIVSRSMIDKAHNQSLLDTIELNKNAREIVVRPGRMGELYRNLLTLKTPSQERVSQDQRRVRSCSHEQLAKRILPPGHRWPGPPHLGR